jgi:hypothetical protein
VRDRLVQIVKERKFAAYTESLVKTAKIESRLPPSPPAPTAPAVP